MAQVGGLAVGGSEDESIPLLAAVERAASEMVRPGDRLVITAQVVANRSGIVKVEAEAKVKDVLCSGAADIHARQERDVVGRG